MAALDDARTFYFAAVATFARMLAHPDTVPTAIDAVNARMAALTAQPKQGLKEAIRQALVLERSDYPARVARAQALMQLGRAWYLEELGSRYVDGGNITNDAGAFIDINEDMVAGGYYVQSECVFAADPTPADGILLERISVDENDQAIEGGNHNETVTAKVTLAPLTGAGVGRGVVELFGQDGPEDDLDHRTGGTAERATVQMDIRGDQANGLILNSPFNPSAGTADAAAITADNLPTWGPLMSGASTVVYDTAVAWRDKEGSLLLSGNGTSKTFTQPFVLPGNFSPLTPLSVLGVFTPLTGFQGSVAITVGNMTKTVVHGTMVMDDFNYMTMDKDEDRYPVNFDDGDVQAEIEITITAGSIHLHFFDAQEMTARQGHYYAAWFHDDNPVLHLEKTWADRCDYDSPIQSTVRQGAQFAPYAYHPTAGSSEIVFDPFDPEITAFHGITEKASGGSIALGNVTAGAHNVTVRVKNTGAGVLVIDNPTYGTNTNITSTTDDVTRSEPIGPGDYRDIAVVVTDAGVGAFSTTMTITNSDANEGTYTIVISGTAV